MAEPGNGKPAKDNSKMGKQVEDQARDVAAQQDRTRSDFATGKKRFTEGK